MYKMLHISISKCQVIKKKLKEPTFKPESNQPNIKNLIIPPQNRGQKVKPKTTTTTPVQKGGHIPGNNNSKLKKREPPTPPERINSAKKSQHE